jgi:hypothetical protein
MNFAASALIALCLTCGPADAQVSERDRMRAVQALSETDHTRALELWLPLAENDDPEAQYYVGWLLMYGDGISHDYAAALHWLILAAEADIPNAQMMVGWTYAYGRAGVAQDLVLAVHWLERAAENGVAFAQYELAQMILDGRGTDRDPQQAFRWMMAAARQGLSIAQSGLADMYRLGQGVAQDDGLALQWYLMAWREIGEIERQWIQRNIADLEARMDEAAISDARRNARGCRENGFNIC